MALGTIAAVVGALAGLTSTGYGIYQAQQSKPDDPGHGWSDWLRARTPAGLMMQQMFYNPQYAGMRLPWEAGSAGDVLGPGNLVGQFKPSQSTQALYGHYLSRQYGLPENVARSMSTSAIQPLRGQALPQGGITAPQARQLTAQPDVGQLTQSAMGYYQPHAMRQMDYLQNAANLAQFNAWRVQQTPRVIG